jgi:hypothetical protein
MNKIEEIAQRIYNINRQISWKWIAMKKQPTELEISDLNKILGEIIKDLREISENKFPQETKELIK